MSNRSATVGMSSAQYPSRFARRSKDSRRARKAELLHRSSCCLRTHCRFTFAPCPSVAVSFEQGSRLIFSGCSLSLLTLSPENYWRDWTELNGERCVIKRFIIISLWRWVYNRLTAVGPVPDVSAAVSWICVQFEDTGDWQAWTQSEILHAGVLR